MNELEMLINEYLSCAKYSCSLLRTLYTGPETILRAKVLKLIPNEGSIEGVLYRFHGLGCYFEYSDYHIDIDFGPDGRCDGFDLFRLKDFFSGVAKKENYPLLMKREDSFEQQFRDLVDAKIIHNPKLEPATHLYYFNHEK